MLGYGLKFNCLLKRNNIAEDKTCGRWWCQQRASLRSPLHIEVKNVNGLWSILGRRKNNIIIL